MQSNQFSRERPAETKYVQDHQPFPELLTALKRRDGGMTLSGCGVTAQSFVDCAVYPGTILIDLLSLQGKPNFHSDAQMSTKVRESKLIIPLLRGISRVKFGWHPIKIFIKTYASNCLHNLSSNYLNNKSVPLVKFGESFIKVTYKDSKIPMT